MAGPKQKMLYLLVILLAAFVVGCGDGSTAVEGFEEPLSVSIVTTKLPSWLLIAHRSETLPDEELGFVAIESEYRINLEEEKIKNEELEAEENNAFSNSTVKTSSFGSSSGSSDDKWESSVTTPQQNSNSGSWWDQASSDNSNSGQIVHKVQYNIED
jgi:hypothetical protein